MRALGKTVAIAVAAGAFAWTAHAGDGTRTLEERVAALEATVATHERRLVAIAGPLPVAPAQPVAPTQPPAMSDTPPAVDPNTITVYATATGGKYHRAGCSYLRSSGTPITLAEALRRGLTPCSRCGGR